MRSHNTPSSASSKQEACSDTRTRPQHAATSAMATPGLTATTLLVSSKPASASVPESSWQETPQASEGPFYPAPNMRFSDSDNNLVNIGQSKIAGGQVVRITGKLLAADQTPISRGLIEIWQCDVNGRYLHLGDRGGQARDRLFQGFGQSYTAENGYFEFRTIKPVPYPGRTPHIHIKVVVGNSVRLVSQLYLRDHPFNLRDGLYRRIPENQRDLVTLDFDQSEEPEAFVRLVV